MLVTLYHACHRALSGAEATYPFAVKNFTDLLAEALGTGGRHDYYKQYKRGGEMDEAIAAAKSYLAQNGVALDAATVTALDRRDFQRDRNMPATAPASRPRSPRSRRLYRNEKRGSAAGIGASARPSSRRTMLAPRTIAIIL